MSLNIDGSDITDALGGGGGGPSPSDPIQDAKISDLENKTQNINLASTDGTKTTFNNDVVAPVVEAPEARQGTNLFYVYNNDFTGSEVNTKDNSIPKFDTDGKKIQHSNFFITDNNNYGSVLYNEDTNGSANCFFGVGQVASGFANVHIGKNITAGNNLNNQNVLIGSNLKAGNGQNNIQIGTLSGPNVDGTNNQQNICIGWGAGNSINTGGNNIFLGEQASSNNDSIQGIGIGKSALVRRNQETVLSTTVIRPNVDNVCDLGTPNNDPLHVARFKNLYLSGNTNNVNTFSSGLIQAPLISGTTQVSCEKITNFDNPTTTVITIAPTTGIISFHKDILPSVGNLLNFGTDTAGGRFNNIASQTIILNDKGQSNKYYNKNGTAGIDIGNTATGAINLTGTKYQGHNNSIVTLNGSGQIQQPSDNATIDGNGNATFKNIELLNIASSGEIKAKIIQSNDVANTLSLLNRSTIAGKGIIIDATTNGNIQFTGDSYINDPNRLIRLNTNGTIEKTPIICDGPTNNNISGINTLSANSTVSSNMLNSGTIFSPNYFLGSFGGGNGTAGTMNINSGNITNTGDITPITDNTEDIGTLALAYKDIHIKGDVYKNGVIYSTGGGGGSGLFNCFSESVLLKEVGTIAASNALTVQTRNLNTLINPLNYTWCTLSAPTFTLSVGTYAIRARGTAYQVAHTQAYIYNVTDAVYENTDQPIVYSTDPEVVVNVPCETIINVTGTAKQYQLRHWTENASVIGLSGNKTNGNMTNNPGPTNTSLSEVSIIKLGQVAVGTNAEYDAIALKWTQERSVATQQLTKIYLPQGVPVGSFDHTQHNVYILTQDPTNGNRQWWDVRFIGYQGSTSTVELPLTNIINAIEIYNGSSQAHPNNVQSSDEKQHIINHFISDYNHYFYPNIFITSVVSVAVQTADVGSWDHTKPFYVLYNTNSSSNNPFITNLYGSQSGFNQSGPTSNPPLGYTFI